MKLLAAIAVLAVLFPIAVQAQEAAKPPAPAQPPAPAAGLPTLLNLGEAIAFSIMPGQRVTFEMKDGGVLNVLKIDQATQAQVMPPQGRVTEADMLRLNTAQPGQVVVSMIFVQGFGALVKLESGLGYGIDYTANMTVRGQGGRLSNERTSVCTVRPGVPMFEHWEQPIEFLMLGGFRRYDGEPHCPEPPQGQEASL